MRYICTSRGLKLFFSVILALLLSGMTYSPLWSRGRGSDDPETLQTILDHLENLGGRVESQNFTNQSLAKRIDDLLWYFKVGDICDIAKVRYIGPPPRVIRNPTGQGAGNPLTI